MFNTYVHCGLRMPLFSPLLARPLLRKCQAFCCRRRFNYHHIIKIAKLVFLSVRLSRNCEVVLKRVLRGKPDDIRTSALGGNDHRHLGEETESARAHLHVYIQYVVVQAGHGRRRRLWMDGVGLLFLSLSHTLNRDYFCGSSSVGEMPARVSPMTAAAAAA